MIKCFLFLRAPAGAELFVASGADAAAALRRACPAAVGYAQTRALAEQLDPAAQPPFAGVAELWFVDAAAALSLASNPEPLTSLLAEEVMVAASAVGMERIVMRLPTQHDGECIKGVFPFQRRKGMSSQDFSRYWLYRHGPIAARTEEALLYVQYHPLAEADDLGATPEFGAVTELYWRDVAAARQAMTSRQMREDQARDTENFVEPGSVLLFLAAEELVLPP